MDPVVQVTYDAGDNRERIQVPRMLVAFGAIKLARLVHSRSQVGKQRGVQVEGTFAIVGMLLVHSSSRGGHLLRERSWGSRALHRSTTSRWHPPSQRSG